MSKIKSIKRLGTLSGQKVDLVLEQSRPYVVVEGSLLDCDGTAKKAARNALAPLAYDLKEIGLPVITNDAQFAKFLDRAGASSKINLMEEHLLQSVVRADSHITPKLVRAVQGFDRNRVGLVIDARGWSAAEIAAKKTTLEGLGYDCMGVFVNRPKDTIVIKHGALTPAQITELWSASQKNISSMSELFGGHLVIADGSSRVTAKLVIENTLTQFLLAPIRNTQGQSWERKVHLVRNR